MEQKYNTLTKKAVLEEGREHSVHLMSLTFEVLLLVIAILRNSFIQLQQQRIFHINHE